MSEELNDVKKRKRVELPRLYFHTHSTIDRPRRNQKKAELGQPIVPKQFWGGLFFCLEYPKGIYIDKNGTPQPSSKLTNSVAIDDGFSDLETSSEDEYVATKEDEEEEDEGDDDGEEVYVNADEEVNVNTDVNDRKEEKFQEIEETLLTNLQETNENNHDTNDQETNATTATATKETTEKE